MKNAYWPFAMAGVCFVGWAHCHTDEIPIVLGFVLILGFALGAAWSGHFLTSWVLAGAPLFPVETMVHFGWISAPYPPSAGLPFVALVAYVPALLGVAAGTGVRRLMRSEAIR